jgi:bifunctional DNA-binding transcriptional regulator/antitoxin component of YhaV-PrlF toxin-antitoxin module
VVAKVRERLSARKQAAQKTDVERFNLKKLSEMEVRRQFQIEISNRFEALENLNDSEDVNRAWENIRELRKMTVSSCSSGCPSVGPRGTTRLPLDGF